LDTTLTLKPSQEWQASQPRSWAKVMGVWPSWDKSMPRKDVEVYQVAKDPTVANPT
jgi:hypothetical protein